MLDHYCERVAPGLLAEPLNAVTNAAFVLAAIAAGAALRRRRGSLTRRWDLWLLVALTVFIGAGSALWHTLATGRALLADVVPILLFVYLFLASFLMRVAVLPAWAAALVLGAYVTLDQLVRSSVPRDALNGSLFYLPAWLALVAAAVWLVHKADPSAPRFRLAALLFTAALVLRTVDQALCPMLPSGTHFFWHLLNAVVLYLLLTGLVRRDGNERVGERTDAVTRS